ncbi:MAG TPA: hypothetical protein VGN83_15875 [Falsiroseomonas sp.]|jgi:hypothetical protein|nr:hypothetical protein [Falsiroseomonas sp.]
MPDGGFVMPTLAALAASPRWVAWQTQDRGGKATKVPYAPLHGLAKAGDPSTWGSREAAELRAAKLPRPFGSGGVGLQLGDHLGLAIGGIDLDTCRNAETGILEPWATEVVARFASYTEVSPSSTGVKIFVTLDAAELPMLLAAMNTEGGKVFKQRGDRDHPPAIEIYLASRYFAVTDQRLDTAPAELRRVGAAVLLWLLNDFGPAFAGSGETARARPQSQRGDGSRSALAFRKGKQLVREGASYDEMCVALRTDPETAQWMREKGDTNNGREARRIFEAANAKGDIIRLRGGQLHNEATAGEDALLAAGRPIYQRGNGLVRPAVQLVPASRGRTTHSACLVEVSAHGLIDNLCAVATWERFDARADEWLEVNPPMAVAQTILSRAGEWRFPRIAGVITTPTLRPDGSILSEAGYDKATRLYHTVDPDLRLHRAVKAPTRADAEKALVMLSNLLAEFPFTDPVSKAVALSGLITPVVRGALSVVPLHAFKANTAGTGKSYLADVSSAISTGRPCPVASAAADEAETEKRIAGLLLAGFPISSLDNVNGEFGGDLLCQAIERPLVRIRPLGRSDIVEIESRATLFATGNNFRVRGDMVRRTLICSLDAGVERPELREFHADPVATVMADRGLYVSACLIIVRAYEAAGRPGLLKPIASFEDWSGAVRSALVWLGCEDPARSMEAAREDDPDLTELREILGLWHASFGKDDYTTSEVVQQVSLREETKMGEPTDYRHPDLRDALLRIFGERGEINTKKMGNWLRAKEGRIAEGLRIRRGTIDPHKKVQRWMVARCGPESG